MSDDMYDLTVIIPFYNNKFDEFERALQSISYQDEISVEIIIIDDGSEEKVSLQVKNYVKKYTDVVLLRQENKGVSSARNRGVYLAKGKYITFLDADDTLSEHFFSDIRDIIPLQPDLILGGSKIVRQCNTHEVMLDKVVEHVHEADIINLWKCRLYGKTYIFSSENRIVLNRGIAAKVVRSDIAKSLVMKEELKLGEDTTWFLQAIKKSHYVVVCNQLWYLYYDNIDSATRKYNPGIVEQSRKSLFSIRNEIDLAIRRESEAYVDRIIRELLFISDNYINHCENNLSCVDRLKIIHGIYTDEPWSFLKYFRNPPKEYKKTIMLYKLRVLFFWWKIKRFVKRPH